MGTILGPFWLIGKRGWGTETAEMIDLFLKRGEDINEQQGPSGTAIHSQVDEAPTYSGRLVELLVRKGANINRSGPQGNALEYLWRKFNTVGSRRWRKLREYGSAIRHLIGLGAVNSRPDPNGLVPSIDRMMTCDASWNEYLECRRYYLERHLKDGEVPDDSK